MARVVFTHKGGRDQLMSEADAKVLHRLGRGAYMTRDMVAGAAALPDNLNSLDAKKLHEIAKKRGVKVHHLAGAEKVREALRNAGSQ